MKEKCWKCECDIEIDLVVEWGRIYGFSNPDRIDPPNKPWKRFYCKDCEDEVNSQLREDKAEYINLKIKLMFERAIKILERQTKLQYKIENYRADFYLEDLKCIVEIDGERHDNKLFEDSNRDIKIRSILGPEWEVVRIPTKYLEKDATKLLTAVKKLKLFKQQTRNKNGGIIPASFSKRDRAKSLEMEKIAGNIYG